MSFSLQMAFPTNYPIMKPFPSPRVPRKGHCGHFAKKKMSLCSWVSPPGLLTSLSTAINLVCNSRSPEGALLPQVETPCGSGDASSLSHSASFSTSPVVCSPNLMIISKSVDLYHNFHILNKEFPALCFFLFILFGCATWHVGS